MNCWEFKKCGREINGENAESLGVCPACTETKTNGINNGKNGGRCCWAIAGTLCDKKVQGSFAEKVSNCMKCDFYKLVWKEQQENNYTLTTEILKILRG